MARKVVAIDIDDVLVDTAEHMIGGYNARYGTKLTRGNYYSKDPDVHGVKHFDEAAKRFEEYIRSGALTKAAPLPEAVEVVRRLSKHYEFVGVTSRPEYIAEATGEWLKEHFGVVKAVFTSFIMGASDHQGSKLSKAEVCQDIGAKYMIEDHLHHALPVADCDIEVLLFDQLWNQTDDDLPKNITRVRNWKEIEEYLDERARQ